MPLPKLAVPTHTIKLHSLEQEIKYRPFLVKEEKLAKFKFERNGRLAVSDWTQLSDSPLSSTKKAEWATYRQALRDLPASANPQTDDAGELVPSSVTWPTR